MYKRIIFYIARAMSKINQLFADTSARCSCDYWNGNVF